MDAANGDFTLQSTSPAIDAGTDSYTDAQGSQVNIPSTDYKGSKPDMGAVEYEP